jgi:hypothetical protein
MEKATKVSPNIEIIGGSEELRQKIADKIIIDLMKKTFGIEKESCKNINEIPYVTTYLLNLTTTALDLLRKLDSCLVGTPHYMGIAYFWAYEYRHYLRDKEYETCRICHQELLLAGLDVSGVSDEHEKIISLF